MDKNLIKQEAVPTPRLGPINIGSPKTLIDGASDVANALATLIKKQKLSVNIQGKEYVKVEGWTTLGALMGVMPREVQTEEKNGVYISTVELVRMSDGMVLSRASAECGHDKPWNGRPRYARRSMAQTRATGKACRLAFGWIMGLAGYATTPYEEMEGIAHNGHIVEADVTQAQRRKLWAMAKEHGLTEQEMRDFAHWAKIDNKKRASEVIDNFDDLLAKWQEETAGPVDDEEEGIPDK